MAAPGWLLAAVLDLFGKGDGLLSLESGDSVLEDERPKASLAFGCH